MEKSLTEKAYIIGKMFGNEKLTISVDSNFKETMCSPTGMIKAYSVHCELTNGDLGVYLCLPEEITDREKVIRIAHEFGEIELRKKHPTISRMLHILSSKKFVGDFSKLLNDSLADMEARKKGFNIPYSYHLGYYREK